MVAAPLDLPTRALQAAILASAFVIGVLAGVDPLLAVVATLGLGFVVLAMADLTLGLALFAVLTFLDTVLPGGGGGAVSGAKAMGLLLVLSWLALITTGEVERRERIFSHPAFLGLVTVFIGWTAMSVTWAEEPGNVVETVIRYVPNALLFLIVYSAVRDRRSVFIIVGAFVVGALVSAAYGIAVPTDPDAADRLSGGAGNANETAAALVAGTVLAAALAASLKEQPVLRVLALAAVPFCAYGILLTLSRGGLVALAAALVASVFVAGRWRPVAVAAALVVAASAVVYFATFAPEGARERVTTIDGGTGRTDVWTVGWRMVEDHPVRGIGAGNFPNTSVHYLLEPGALLRDDFIVDTPKVAHNMYLEVLAELGIPGLLMFLGILGFSLVCTLKAVRGFRDSGDEGLEIISRAVFVALVGLLAADFFGSRQFSKQLWLLLALAPALLAIARAQLASGSADREALPG